MKRLARCSPHRCYCTLSAAAHIKLVDIRSQTPAVNSSATSPSWAWYASLAWIETSDHSRHAGRALLLWFSLYKATPTKPFGKMQFPRPAHDKRETQLASHTYDKYRHARDVAEGSDGAKGRSGMQGQSNLAHCVDMRTWMMRIQTRTVKSCSAIEQQDKAHHWGGSSSSKIVELRSV